MTTNVNRRKFMGSAVATGVITIVPRHVLGGAAYVAPSRQITLAHVGMGTQGFREIGGLLADPEIRIVAVCDPNTDSNDYVEWGPNGIRNTIRSLIGKPTWREGRSGCPGGREVGREVVDAYYANQKGARIQVMPRLCRLPRTAGQGKGPGRRQGHDARPSSRHRLRRGHEEGQARHGPQAAGQPHG